MTTSPKFIIVIGTSAGGMHTLQELLPQLNEQLDAAVLIVMHFSRKGTGSSIVNKLQQYSALPCHLAINGEPLEKGMIYVAPPDHHLLVDENGIVTGKGAPENRWRPSINNLFRSAAALYTSRVIGIILTGLLDDGTAGMSAVKQAGGLVIIQDPAEAEYPDMPASVQQNVVVDYQVKVPEMGKLLAELCRNPLPPPVEVPGVIKLEAALDRRVSTRVDNLANLKKVDVSCPDCGGGLYITQEEHPKHYRCHVGHSYTDKDLILRVSEVMENTLWTALRMMEEKRFLLTQLLAPKDGHGYGSLTTTILQERVAEMDTHIENLKQLIFSATAAES